MNTPNLSLLRRPFGWQRWTSWLYCKKLERELHQSQDFERWLRKLGYFHLAEAEAASCAEIRRRIEIPRKEMTS
jgi:hypothetical protein